MEDIEREFVRKAIECQPWLPKPEWLVGEQELLRNLLRKHSGLKNSGAGSFIARSANVFTDSLSNGRDSWVATGAILRGHISIGDNSSVNPYAHVAGIVKIGSGVRVGGATAIYGFNHGFSRRDIPIHAQPQTNKGIDIRDGCWIGANAAVIDGVTIGANTIIGAGAVVTQSIPEWCIAVGNPARVVSARPGGE